MKHIKILFFSFLIGAFFSCTKLDETFRSELSQNTSGSVTAGELLINAYNSLGTFQTGNIWHLEEHTSDEILGPTRGPDWDDNGQWRALHAHTWNADHGIVSGAFSDLLSAQFAASNVLQFNPSAQQAAEARFIRALTVFFVLDGWGQVPYREDLNDYRLDPTTLKGTEAADFVISELNAILNDLPDSGPAYTANKNAARFLLMKTYLNYGAFADRANPSFDAGNMNQVITLADQIIGSGKYALSADYYDNFSPDNDTKSTENIFTLYNQNGDRGGNVQGTWFQISHYNMDPGGWNGFATLSDFYDKFEPTDKRIGEEYIYPGARPNPGHRRNVGFFIGQQYNLTTDAALQDRKGNPLSFTREVSLRETGNNLEVTGIRAVKYAYDYNHYNSQNNNDWALFRYADVLLMKAEALLRTGDASGALDIVNSLRTARGASSLTSLNEANLLDERGREFYWEGWRRQDLIRFGKYLDLWQEKTADDPKNLLFPIPSNQLAVNANLEQNPGY
ncbi:RagB/SusD family nutrient uptake outer membrane protein [Panacibacter ginsenosidivorans]|uniref:RagB/SusD family nutrient uptake outer membrane protein n=1 Tax=Panacibacter ginsenosidivorans TaxID=1813871 RepID=A0A5B8VAX5_9BACT|nr:RagB/SusD family nutrient uptake outer membrane protein [Panacibacter ginsenosidivorans]QEC68620.1 RagB/SusD family nutrient uptake outer membrane protein [Panacibacter ginsenosidivorans]